MKAYIRRKRVARIRQRLETSRDPVKRIAIELGYPSGASMGREFKLHTGQTITQFRRSLDR